MLGRRLPRTVRIGRGYKVMVRMLSPKQMQRMAGDTATKGLWVESFPVRSRPQDGVIGKIYVRNDLEDVDRWRIYWHELLHCIHDVQEWDT